MQLYQALCQLVEKQDCNTVCLSLMVLVPEETISQPWYVGFQVHGRVSGSVICLGPCTTPNWCC